MAYRFITTYKNYFGLRWLLRKMNIHPNAYYHHLKNHKKAYHSWKEKVCTEIKKIYNVHK